jgi:hypothetical protein
MGTYVFTASVTDAEGISITKQLQLIVREPWPIVTGLYPQSGTGTSMAFTALVITHKGESPNGIELFIGDDPSVPANGCLLRNATGAFTVPVSTSCTLDLAASSRAMTPTLANDETRVTFAVGFKPGVAGLQKLFVRSSALDGKTSPWILQGTWTVTAPARSEPLVVALSPTAGANATQTFTGAFSHTGGPSQLYLAYILLLPTPNIVQYTAAGSCLVEYNRISHAMRLINEAGDDWLGPLSGVPLTRGGTLTNSRCTLNIGASSAQIAGSSLVVNASITLNSTVTGTLATFLQAFDVNGGFTGMTQFGNWSGTPRATPKPGPYVVSMTPANVANSAATYTLTVGHTAGVSQLGLVNLRFNSGIAGGAPCHVVYFPGSNTINLVNDSDSGLAVRPDIILGSVSIGTQRCIVDEGSSRTIAGNTLTLNLQMRFITSTFAGIKTVYANVFDLSGNLTHWVQTGTLTVP